MVYGQSLAHIVDKEGFKKEIKGTTITEMIWNKTHQGIMGNLSIDGNGDRKTDYSLLDFSPENEKFQVVKIYHGVTNSFQMVGEVHWPGRDGPPPDTPRCGFDG